MILQRLYSSKNMDSYIGLFDDGEYRRISDTGRIGSAIVRGYIPPRLGKSVEDITDSVLGRLFIDNYLAEVK